MYTPTFNDILNILNKYHDLNHAGYNGSLNSFAFTIWETLYKPVLDEN